MRTSSLALGVLLVAALATAAEPVVVDQARAAAEGRQVLARIPAERLAKLPAPVIDGVLKGEIPAAEFAAAFGFGPPVRALGTPSQLESKQFVTHWLYHYPALKGGINDDLVGESTINGRCSEQKFADGANAPSMDSSYWGSSDGSMYLGYYYAPYDSTTCSYTNTNLTEYWVTWVKAPTTRSGYVFLGSADYFKLWINGTLVKSRLTGGSHPFTSDEYSATVTLVAGWNLIVLKQSFPQLGPETDPDNNNRYKYFSLRFATNSAGTAMTDLVAAFDPNCTETDTSVYTRLYMPNVAHLAGTGGSVWRTDFYLYNGTQMRWQYRLRYYKEGNATGVPTAEKLLELAPLQAINYTDVLSNPLLFGLSADSKGYVVILQQNYSYLSDYHWAIGKTYNSATAGTFGTLSPAYYLYNGTAGSGEFFGVRNGAYRSNFAMFPAVNTAAPVDITLTLFGSAFATPVVKQYTGIQGFWQLNNIFADMGVGSVTTDSATVMFQFTNNPSSTNWFPYITVNDGNPAAGITGTSDPVFLGWGWFGAWPYGQLP
jgi:hypothetical protein